MTSECLNLDDYQAIGGKIYLPSVHDPTTNYFHSFVGHCDQDDLPHSKINIREFLCTCRVIPYGQAPPKAGEEGDDFNLDPFAQTGDYDLRSGAAGLGSTGGYKGSKTFMQRTR